jgi:uncharacterized repeat protein (TIGR03803 family)
MKSNPGCHRELAVVATVVLFLLSTAAAKAREKVLWRFNFKDGAYPATDLIEDPNGNLYGTVYRGLLQGGDCGSYGCGGVFELSPTRGGTWKYSVIYSFKTSSDAALPTGRLLMDEKGDLYGVSLLGPKGNGSVYKLKKTDGKWKDEVLYAFPGFNGDGGWPVGDLAMDVSGNLYGTTRVGGIYGGGIVYELSPLQNGDWTETILHSLGNGNDGSDPRSGIAMDGQGNLFGIAQAGGNNNNGTVFELSPTRGTQWDYSTIYYFDGYTTGCCSYTPITLDSDGNIYGMTSGGGPEGQGIIFELTQSSGTWQETTIYDYGLFQRVVLDGDGDLLGANYTGGNGCYGGCGAIEELKPVQGGWNLLNLHNFQSGGDGSRPIGLLIGKDGNFYGPTQYGGGMYGYGVLYEIVP